ncbi:MAG: serine/threonine-protein kinase [Gemmatimonadaceae bacterium]
MPQIPPDRRDEMLGEHYRIERELGHGGMATVYLCADVRDESRVAVKVLRPELGSVVTRERFFREIAFSSELDHPRIPRVLESGTTSGGLPFYAMDFVDGESLRDRLMREPRLAVDEVQRIAVAIAGPMGYAHERSIVHRDIKPENILLSGDKVYVLDFGVARAIAGSTGDRLTRTGITLGTPAYMSPEQVMADRDLDLRSDIYSLGCVVYEMLAGVTPFTAGSPQMLMAARFSKTPKPLSSIRDDVPEGVAKAIDKAMARKPEDRWQTVDAFADAMLPTKSAETDPVADGEPAASIPGGVQNEMLDQLKNSFVDVYEVNSEMKGGGMSRLFLATDIALRRRVVIKILPPDLLSPMMLARFRRESEVTAALQHPHILPVISAGVKDGLVHYIMPFIDGESLRGVLEREHQLPIPYAIRILREMTDALAYAHKLGVIHRDIKQENVLIQDGHAVLADFGIAAALSSADGKPAERLTGTGMSLGTVGYMAPEQALGERNVDARSDIYSVGVVGYEIFTGVPPFTGATDQAILVAHLTKEAPSVIDVRADTPLNIAESIRKAMEKDPALRFQTAAEFRDSLDATPGVAVPLPQRFDWKTGGKLWLKRSVLIPLALIAIGALGFFYWKGRGVSGSTERVTIAIAPFDALNSDLALWREGMVDVLARNLDGVGPFVTVSPTVSIKGFVGASNANSAKQVAQRTNAQYAVFGRLVGSSVDTVRLHGGYVNATDGKVWETDVRDSTVEATAARFTIALLGQLGKTHRIGAVRHSSFGSQSVDALRAFLQGEQFYRRTSWDSAAVSYARAVRFDTSFAIALRREAQVVGWQKDGKDSVARTLWLSAGMKNRGLTPRDSLLITADSISAALAPVLLDSMDWHKVTRLFETVNTAASRYPSDPEVWYAVGEARFHYGWANILNVTDRSVLDAFNRSIALDSAFAPAYPHAVELAFSLDGAAAGRRYADAYLRGNPTDKEAEGIAIVSRVARGTASAESDSVLDQASASALLTAYFILRHWPDTAQTALKLLQSVNRRPRSSPTFVADSTRLWNFMPLQLAYHGRMAEAYLIIGDRPSRMFVEMALLGGIPPATATRVTGDWVDKNLRQAFFALPWFSAQKDSAHLKRLVARADAEAAVGGALARRSAKYRASSARAYLRLVRNDTATAIKEFTALNDTLCIACYVDRLETAKLLATRGRFAEAEKLLSGRVYNLITPVEIWIAFERAQVAARLGHRDAALRDYRQVVAAWSTGDREIQHYVTDARHEIARAGARLRGP